MSLVFGAAVLILLLAASDAFAKADPQRLARSVRFAGGCGALIFASFLLLRGEFGAAVPVALIGLTLLGYMSLAPLARGRLRPRGSGDVFRVRSAFLEMEFEQSGAIRGHLIAGRHRGASLDALDVATLVSLSREMDSDSSGLLAAYLDRREPRWREHAQADAAAGGNRRVPAGSKMTKEEAYQILGIRSGASAQEISRAHRSLMKKLHPDQGGSTNLAARVNEAKDVLTRRHR
ncbi:MAG TPA: DnaJ domain-containing protein [Xanthobacteraceae bacterium]|jgi:hypothetical protein